MLLTVIIYCVFSPFSTLLTQYILWISYGGLFKLFPTFKPVLHTTYFPRDWIILSHRLSPHWRKMNGVALTVVKVGNNFGRARVRTHNHLNSSQCRYPLSYRGPEVQVFNSRLYKGVHNATSALCK